MTMPRLLHLASSCPRQVVNSVLLALLFAASTVWAAQPTVIVLSWDGVRWDYPDRAEYQGLGRMQREGVRGKLTPVFPSKTFPTHVSMATGTYPDRHGIMDNNFWDPQTQRPYAVADADWLQAEPVWIAAQRQGVNTATYFWVGSESDWRGQGTAFRETPFDGKRPEAQKVDQYLRWLDLPADERPHLIMGYWAGTDSVGHVSGPDDPGVAVQLGAQDAELQRLLAGLDERELWDTTTLVIVSDHGMIEVSQTVDVAGALAAAGVEARVNGTNVGQVFLADRGQTDAAESALRALAGKYPVAVYRREEIPTHWRLHHPTRTGDLVVDVAAPYQIATAALRDRIGALRGSHGFDPALPELKSAIFAMGRGVASVETLVEAHQVDLAATIAALLGINPPLHSEGQPMDWMDASIAPPNE